ncbi:MAG: type 1 glutamine amidotransferase domain-containing protein, partial [Bacteroidota bacterium]
MQLLYLILFSYIILGDQIQEPNNLEASKVLFVVSNAHYYGSSEIPASNHFAEIALPYDVFIQEGFEVDLVSPEGGAIPIGYINTSDSIIKQYLYDCEFMQKLQSTLKPNEVRPSQYQAIFYGGGGASMFGVANNEAIQSIAMHIYENNQGVVSAVCHGSIGIANLKKADGASLFSNKSGNPLIFLPS